MFECGHTFSRADNLTKHYKQAHDMDEVMIQQLKSKSTLSNCLIKDSVQTVVPDIWQLAAAGNSSLLEELVIRRRVDVNQKAGDRSTALHSAARANQEKVCQLLLSWGADLTIKNMANRTPVAEAMMGNSSTIINLFLDNSWDTIYPDVIHDALEVAFKQDFVRKAHFLLQEYVEALDSRKVPLPDILLQYGVRLSHPGVVERLVTCPNVDVNIADSKSFAPIHYAARIGDCKTFEALLKCSRVNINLLADYKFPFRSAALIAARFGHRGILQSLLGDSRCTSNTLKVLATRHGTPLSLAVRYGHADVAKLLIEYGDIDLNTANIWVAAPLQLAVQYGQDEIVKLLLQNMDVNINRGDINRVVHEVQRQMKSSTLKLLLSREDLDINAENWYGKTLLHLIAEREPETAGTLEILELLLEDKRMNVDTRIRSRVCYTKGVYEGKTALFIARNKGKEKVVAALLAHGAIDDDNNDSGNGNSNDSQNTGNSSQEVLLEAEGSHTANHSGSYSDAGLDFEMEIEGGSWEIDDLLQFPSDEEW